MKKDYSNGSNISARTYSKCLQHKPNEIGEMNNYFAKIVYGIFEGRDIQKYINNNKEELTKEFSKLLITENTFKKKEIAIGEISFFIKSKAEATSISIHPYKEDVLEFISVTSNDRLEGLIKTSVIITKKNEIYGCLYEDKRRGAETLDSLAMFGWEKMKVLDDELIVFLENRINSIKNNFAEIAIEGYEDANYEINNQPKTRKKF
jgi:hypothetical protein